MSCLGLTRKCITHLVDRQKSKPVTAIPHKIIRSLDGIENADVALFITFQPRGYNARHVNHYISALKEAGKKILLIKIVDEIYEPQQETSIDLADGCMMRENHGYDFAAWAHALRLFPELYKARTLTFINDSVFGPFNQEQFEIILKKCDASNLDLIALTESCDSNHHFQSYFFWMKLGETNEPAIRAFWNSVRSMPTRQTVIIEYEMWFKEYLSKSGLKCGVLFPTTDRNAAGINPTLDRWKELIEAGFPFIKVAVLRDKPNPIDIRNWRDILSKEGYDITMIDEHLTVIRSLADTAKRSSFQTRPSP
jgi:lipopolysaccharide biosynthesis protein